MPQLHGPPMPARYGCQLTKSWSETPSNPTHAPRQQRCGRSSRPCHYWANLCESSPSGAGHRLRSKTMNKPVVLITGALTGIGRATAIAFAKDGARLVVSGRRKTEGKALEAELRSLGAEAAFIQADVRHEDEVRDLVDQTVASFGRIDAAVNNAGTEGQRGLVVDQTAESYAATFDTNVLGVLLSMKHELRVMLPLDRKSTRLNSSHDQISYAVFCLKKKKNTK